MRKLHLPVSQGQTEPDPAVADAPSVAAMRARLGGPARESSGVGEVVTWGGEKDNRRTGVVLHGHDDEVDVLIMGAARAAGSAASMVRRTRRSELRPLTGEVHSPEVVRICAAVQTYASMRVGERVSYLDGSGSSHEALIVEKCRYGALVERTDGAVLGVGFRKLRPAG